MAEQQYGTQGLPICPKCSWQCVPMDLANGNHARECSRNAGERAKRLAAAIPLPSTVHGWGYGRLKFELGGGRLIVLDVVAGIRVEDVSLNGLSEAQTVKLVNAIAEVLR